ncbi:MULTISPECIES: ABC transporter permease [Bacillaceae]|uniref:ABC transporter permease n=1 Tax=Evansella alkalicola TaxID=745819 RepID=A0ABS6JX64_9BACI|nr:MULTISPECIES: ABC transporter permease [Bacillaceae]MBU9723182.1 ABC transporter permease [Bacillus alkalicola]
MRTDTSLGKNEVIDSPPQRKELKRFLKVFLGRKIVIFFGLILLAVIFTAIFAEQVAPYDPYAQNLGNALQPPSAENLLGTDSLGRDVLSRVIFGARTSLIVGIISVSLAASIGVVIGLIAGYFGGIIDSIISRLIDAIIAFPAIILALAIGAVIGAGMWTVILALTIGLTPSYARVMRGQVLTVKEQEYIKASEVIGANNIRIMFKHVFPNCISPIIVLITLNLGVAILAEAALSFLGVGITAPQAAWGAMVSEGQRYLVSNPNLSFAPGVCVLLIVLAFNMVGDGLRDALDPRLRGSI